MPEMLSLSLSSLQHGELRRAISPNQPCTEQFAARKASTDAILKKKKNKDLQVFMRRVLPSDSDRRRINLVVQVGAFCLIFHLWLKKKKFPLCFFFLRDTASVLPEENYSV